MTQRSHTPDAGRTELDVFTATPAGIWRAGLAAVAQAPGPAGLARFLQLDDGGKGDYTAERDTLLANGEFGAPTVDVLFDRIAQRAERR